MGARRRTTKLLVSAISLITALLGVELGFRLLGPALGVDVENLREFQRHVARGGLSYAPTPHTVFVRPPGSRGVNSLGFKGEEWKVERAPGVLRIACLGASTTEGGNLDRAPGSYPWQLEQELERRTGMSFEVLNCGISGWTTAETLVAWFLSVQDFGPDLVIIHHAVNDVMPRDMDGFRADYAHWRHAWENPSRGRLERALILQSDAFAWLRMEGSHRLDIGDLTTYAQRGPSPFKRTGRFPPGSEGPFRRNVQSIGLSAESIGASVMLMTMPLRPLEGESEPHPQFRAGTEEHNEILRALAAEHGWLLADAASRFAEDPGTQEHFRDLAHLDSDGNGDKARIAADILIRDWLPVVEKRNSR